MSDTYHLPAPPDRPHWRSLPGRPLSELDIVRVCYGRLSVPRLLYHGFHGAPALCSLEIDRQIIVCTDLDENTGTSVTNRATYLMLGVARALAIPLESLRWVERYEYRPTVFDAVRWTLDERGAPNCPQWRRLSCTSFEEVFAAELPPSCGSAAARTPKPVRPRELGGEGRSGRLPN